MVSFLPSFFHGEYLKEEGRDLANVDKAGQTTLDAGLVQFILT
jgi:hypothetical protein